MSTVLHHPDAQAEVDIGPHGYVEAMTVYLNQRGTPEFLAAANVSRAYADLAIQNEAHFVGFSSKPGGVGVWQVLPMSASDAGKYPVGTKVNFHFEKTGEIGFGRLVAVTGATPPDRSLPDTKQPPSDLWFVAIKGSHRIGMTPEFIHEHGIVVAELGCQCVLFGNQEDARRMAKEILGFPDNSPDVVFAKIDISGVVVTKDTSGPSGRDFVTPPHGDYWFCHTNIAADRVNIPEPSSAPGPRV